MIHKGEERRKILAFEDAPVWQDAIKLSVHVYQVTNSFPEEEKYGITNQVRRSANSVSANLAEGFGRNGLKEKKQFYSIAYGSLLETKSFLYLSKQLGYLDEIEKIMKLIVSLQKQINAIKSSLREKK